MLTKMKNDWQDWLWKFVNIGGWILFVVILIVLIEPAHRKKRFLLFPYRLSKSLLSNSIVDKLSTDRRQLNQLNGYYIDYIKTGR